MYSELTLYYENFRAQIPSWSDPDVSKCQCRGGWYLSEVDTLHPCPCHPDRSSPEDDDDLEGGVVLRVVADNGDTFSHLFPASQLDRAREEAREQVNLGHWRHRVSLKRVRV